MKKLFILILSLLPYIGFAFEYSQAKLPEVQFQSTSNYQSITGYTPQITEIGAANIYNTYSTPKKVSGNPGNPYQTPIGDVPILYIACFTCIFLYYKQLNLE